MNKLVRVLLLGAVAFGIVLALTTAPSSGGTRGQATGYGDDTVPPRSLEVATGANASTSGDGGGSNTGLVLGIGAGVLVLGGGSAFAFSRLRPS
jgi:hypothetical protein